ncbi:MAG TPA: 2-keto-3-deoxygluconate permease, partial [Tissierella sp.]|nr:2-keto-3-deoxygluconate permease [Tissierella sp.]
MKILKTVEKFPGGLMVIPLLLGAVVNTFFPQFLAIGGFTTALFSNKGAATFVGMFIFCCGASINVKQIGLPFYKGSVLTFTKFAVGVIMGVVVGKIWGPAGVLGITPLAIIAALTNSNSVMYSILAGQYGEPTDVGAISVLSLNDGPFFTMIALGLTGIDR